MLVTEPSAGARWPDIYLPRPPAQREKYRYFGKQRRWVFAWLLIAAGGILYGYVHVAEHAWLVAPFMWLLLMVMVPPVVINFWLRTGRPQTDLARAPGHRGQLPRTRRDGGRVPAQLRRATGVAEQHLQVRQQDGLDWRQDRIRTR